MKIPRSTKKKRRNKSDKEIWGFSEDQLRGSNREEIDPRYGYSPRHVLQELGNGIINLIDPHALIYPISRLIRAVPGDYVLEDIRFPSQTKFIKDKGGYVWRIHRDSWKDDLGLTDHSSEDIEWILDDIEPDAEIYNDGDLTHLGHLIDIEIRRIDGKQK